ncbi:MAG: NAD-dependent epimerase/dehydratase family protein [Proteobacteria bacterium]|nr:NAD-dependent epimerase/dehydratase family protein [Pseudomonadota bacterium]
MRVIVFGYGAVGQATVARLSARGDDVVVSQRRAPTGLAGARFEACDILDGGAVTRTVRGTEQIVLAVGFPYMGKVWRTAWPQAMANILAAAEAGNARVVFVDNLYMYGPQRAPLREDMKLTRYGRKPRVRADITRLWQEASANVRVAALRAPDFYGPRVSQSHLGAQAFGNLAQGKAAMLIAPPDTEHDFAYVPDIARAVETLLDAPDADFGQAWHVPSAPITTPRQILEMGAAALGARLKITALPLGLLPLLGLVSPMMAEMAEMRFQWDRPYRVDASNFARRFWSDTTPFAVGAAATARSFANNGAES